MIQTPIRNWWLLAGCGVLDATLALMSFLMFTRGPGWIPDVPYIGPMEPSMLMCRLAVAAGACTIAAGIWSSGQGRSWLLVLNGLALGAYGLTPMLWTGPLSFRFFALPLFIAMALSIGIFALATARTLRRQVADKWFFGLAGAASVGFALAFLALGLRWIKLESSLHSASFLWLASYFGFSAICMIGLALRLHTPDVSQSGPWEALPTLGNPKHAH